MVATQKQYFNDAQLYPLYLMPRDMVAECGRGTGKGLIDAVRLLQCAQHMPGSNTSFVSPSYKKCLTNTLPSLLVHLERWGYKRDLHYTVGKKPWKGLHWKDPIFTPQNWENTIGFYTGSVCQIITQDREGASNGISSDHILIDEAKFVDFEKLRNETFQTNRGNEMYFASCPLHHGLTITCDTAVTKKGSWFMQYESKMDKELIDGIKGLVYQRWLLKKRLQAHPERYSYYQRELESVDRDLAVLRKHALLYCRFPSIFNLAVLGEDFIKRMKRDLPPLTFATSIMCKHLSILQDGFYGALREDVNLYTAPNVSYIRNLDYDFEKLAVSDCRLDSDLDPKSPLIIALDVNTNINWLVVGQIKKGRLNVIKSFWVKNEKTLDDLMADFCAYYKYHKTHQVIFGFDNTFKGNGFALSDNVDFHEFISSYLESHGWLCQKIYIGQAMGHIEKKELINRMFTGNAGYQVFINRDNNEDLLISIQTAGVYNGKKDKRSEKLAETEEDKLQFRTDGSDAFDTLCITVERFNKYFQVFGSAGVTSYFSS